MRRWMLGLILGCAIGAPQAWAAVGKIAYATGAAWVERAGERMPAEVGMAIERRDVLETGDFGRIKAILNDGTKIYVGSRSRIEVARYAKKQSRLVAAMNMFWGRVRFFVHKTFGGAFEVHTTTAVLGVRGTSFLAMTPTPPNLDKIKQQGLDRDFARFAQAVSLPTRVVLDTGKLVIRTRVGAEVELEPGKAADVTPKGEVRLMRADESVRRAPPPVLQPEKKEEKAAPSERAGGKEAAKKKGEAEKKPAAAKPEGGKPGSAEGQPSPGKPEEGKAGAPTAPATQPEAGGGGARSAGGAPGPTPPGVPAGGGAVPAPPELPATPPTTPQPTETRTPMVQAPPAAQRSVQDAITNLGPSSR
ncbi:MAG: hypothetical protein D6771_02895, partial [Zetaproteobacteria bacterium]